VSDFEYVWSVAVFQEDRSVLTRPARAADESVRYGALPEQVVDLWRGTSSAKRRPLVVMIHGGFWRPEYDRIHTAPMCAAIADAGWSIATIEYRRIPGQPDATADDVRASVASVPSLAKHHDGRVVLMGHSAGGHLCLYAAAAHSSPSLAGVIALAPAADLQLVEQLELDNDAVPDFLGVAAATRPDLDPARQSDIAASTVLIHGIEDAIVPIAVSRAYVDTHPTAQLRTLERCGHFALIDPLSSAWSAVVAELQRLAG
jgi:acetyl esterase/lipase